MILWLALLPEAGLCETFYINSRAGDDSHAGNDKRTPWKTLANLEKRTFFPGDSILFARGSSYQGGFIFRHSGTREKPIVFSHYSVGADVIRATDRRELAPVFLQGGAGRAPAFTNPSWDVLNGNIFRIEGSHIVIDGLYFHDNANPPGSDKKNKNVQKLGAVYLALGTQNNIVRNCEFVNTPVGIKVKGTHNLITRNYLHDTYQMMAQSWGPIAIMIVKGNNEISFNRVENYGAYGGPYGSDGGVIELDGVDDDFDANDVHIHHNTSINNHGFLEIAARNVKNITVAYNLSDDKNQFIGGGSIENIQVLNNTVIRTREPNVDRYIFWTFDQGNTHYVLKNNIFYIASDLQVFGPHEKHEGHRRTGIGKQPRENNLYFSPGNADPVGVPRISSDILADPQFLDADNRNFRIATGSPARGKGTEQHYKSDLDQRPLDSGKPSIGCFE